MQLYDILALDFLDRQIADGGVDEPVHQPAVLRCRARLAVDRDIFLQKPAPERRHGRGSLRLRCALARIDALECQGQDFHCPGPRLVGVQRAVAARW